MNEVKFYLSKFNFGISKLSEAQLLSASRELKRIYNKFISPLLTKEVVSSANCINAFHQMKKLDIMSRVIAMDLVLRSCNNGTDLSVKQRSIILASAVAESDCDHLVIEKSRSFSGMATGNNSSPAIGLWQHTGVRALKLMSYGIKIKDSEDAHLNMLHPLFQSQFVLNELKEPYYTNLLTKHGFYREREVSLAQMNLAFVRYFEAPRDKLAHIARMNGTDSKPGVTKIYKLLSQQS